MRRFQVGVLLAGALLLWMKSRGMMRRPGDVHQRVYTEIMQRACFHDVKMHAC